MPASHSAKSTPKSNASCKALAAARGEVRANGAQTPPDLAPRRFPVPDPVGHPVAAVAARTAPGERDAHKGEEKGETDRRRPALWASVGLAAGGAAVAYWSTNRAEAAYERYLRSAGEHRQQAALDRAERHDRSAGAAFLVMEAGLVLTARFAFY